MEDKIYITTPIYYCNDLPHLGSAYTTIAADILARYYRQQGKKVFFLTGTDEHGSKIAQAAEAKGKEPKEFCNEVVAGFKKAWNKINISNDNFIRTTDPFHEKVVQKVLQELFGKQFIYKGEYKGLYCVGCEQFLTETDLIDGKCPDHQKEPQVLKEEAYFFKLSFFQKELLDKIRKDEFEIKPEQRKREMLSFLEKEQLKDVAISRKKVKWGIKLPFDEKHTCYVWVDAFLNYLTGLGWKGKKLPDFWPPEIQLMAKDILRVHATIWPGLLLALKIPLPRKLFVHGFFTANGKKMSKSLGNVIHPIEMAEKYGPDALRYFLFREISFGSDGDVSEERLRERYNSDLASGLGNFLSRVLTLAEKKEQELNPEVQKEIEKAKKNFKSSMQDLKLNEALNSIWELISFCDKYIDREKPWKNKNPKVISSLLIALSEIAEMIKPFLPETSEKMLKQLKEVKKGEPLFPRL